MATTFNSTEVPGGGYVRAWTNLAPDESGDAVSLPGGVDRSVQVSGTFGGATVTIEGSNNGTDWAVLHDAVGDALSFSSAGIRYVAENCVYVRPVVTGGVGSALAVNMLFRRS